MGLFDFLKKKPQEAPFSVTIETKVVEVEVRQNTPGELPMADICGYISPSGGFVNYGRFRVVGMNETTGRKNTRRYEVQNESAARAAAVADGLIDPITVEVEPMQEPSERQIDYALELKAALPEGVCSADVSAIISRITDEDEAAPDPGLSRYAHAVGVKFSRFVGRDALLGYMVAQLDVAELATLYAYAVLRQEKGGDFKDPRMLPVYDALRASGLAAAADPALMKSLKERSVDDFRSPNRGTKIYKAIAANLKRSGAL